MSKAWLLILLTSLTALLFIDPSAAITAMTRGSANAVNLAISLVAVYGLWLGFFGILDKIGVAEKLSKLLRPVIGFLFPDIDQTTGKYITMNISANLLGLGNASTPMAINAMNNLAKDAKKPTTNIIMMIVISATSLQLLPSTVIGLRATHGSNNPTSFLLACLAATILSTIIGITAVKLISKFKQKRRKKS